jgi:hypothetical protein
MVASSAAPLLDLLLHAARLVRAHSWPTGNETVFQMGSILEPLMPYEQDLMILKGVDLTS